MIWSPRQKHTNKYNSLHTKNLLTHVKLKILQDLQVPKWWKMKSKRIAGNQVKLGLVAPSCMQQQAPNHRKMNTWLQSNHIQDSDQMSRKDPRSIVRDMTMQAPVLRGCPFPRGEVGDIEFPPVLLLGEFVETAGNGGSSTSESVRMGSGAWVGGRLAAVISCNRPPGWTGSIKDGFCLPIFKQGFPAITRRTKLLITEKHITCMRSLQPAYTLKDRFSRKGMRGSKPVVMVKCGFL